MSKSKAEYIELYGEEAWKEESKRRRSRRNHERDAAYEEARKGKRNLYFKQRRYKEHLEKVRVERANKEIDPIVTEKRRQYYQANKEKELIRKKEYYQKNKDRIKEYKKLYSPIYYKEKQEKQDPITARGNNLAAQYKHSDRKREFDTSNNITAQWIMDNIFTQKCIYCGDDDWQHLGADRIDNSKPHTPDNVVCACGLCNVERKDKYSVEEFIEYRKTHPRDAEKKPLQLIEEIEKPDGTKIKVIKKNPLLCA